MDDIHFELFIRICVPSVVFQCEGFPLARKRDGDYDINKRMATFGLVWWYEVLDDDGEGCSVIMGRVMGGGNGSGSMDSCGVCREGGCVLGSHPVGGYGGCLLSGGEGVQGRVIFTFLLIELVH